MKSRYSLLAAATLVAAGLASNASAQPWSSTTSWSNDTKDLGTTNTGLLTVDFAVTPSGSSLDGTIGYTDTSTTTTGYNHLNLTVRMNTTGKFDVRNGSTYSSAAVVSYSGGNTYNVKVEVDLATAKYKVWVGATLITSSTGYSFRTGAPSINDLGKVSLFCDTGTYTIQSHSVTAGTGPTPTPTPTGPTPTPTPTPTPGGPTPTPTPTPSGGSSTTKDGVIVPVSIVGSWSYTVREDWRDGGARFNMDGAGASKTAAALVTVGYFKVTSDGGDEVSSKVLGGSHNDSNPEEGCIYDLGIGENGSGTRMRGECPHPDYTSTLSGAIVAKSGLTFVNNWRGMMTIVRQQTGGVRIEWFQDQGNNATSPANQWVKVYEFYNTGDLPGIEGGDMFPLRTTAHANGSQQNTWRVDNAPGLAQKWLAIAEIAREDGM